MMDRSIENADYIIIGSGCSGLSLAVNMLEAGMTDRKIILLDVRTEFNYDHTWCFWNVEPHLFEDAISNSWSKWRVATSGGEVIKGSAHYAYQHIKSTDFYVSALNRIHQSPNIQLRLGQPVFKVTEKNRYVEVETSSEIYRAELVFDSRPPLTIPARRGIEDICLLQHFRGWVVKTEVSTFNQEVATLMDFQTHAEEDVIQFMYILPYSDKEALIEAVFISEKKLDKSKYDKAIQTYILKEYGNVKYEVKQSEQGFIPMSTAPFPVQAGRRVYNIGIAGGMAKPSTGYAFMAIQQNSAQLAARLKTEEFPKPTQPRKRQSVFLDRIFLSYLHNHPEVVPALFLHLFSSTAPDTLIRFLNDQATLKDTMRIISNLPVLPFLVEAAKSQELWRAA